MFFNCVPCDITTVLDAFSRFRECLKPPTYHMDLQQPIRGQCDFTESESSRFGITSFPNGTSVPSHRKPINIFGDSVGEFGSGSFPNGIGSLFELG